MSSLHYIDSRELMTAHYELGEADDIAKIAILMEPVFQTETDSMQDLFFNHAAHVFVCDAVQHVASRDARRRRADIRPGIVHPGLVHTIRPFIRNTSHDILVPPELPESLGACRELLDISTKRIWHSAVSRHIALYLSHRNMATSKSKFAMLNRDTFHQKALELLETRRRNDRMPDASVSLLHR